jgi:hypothetical protein
MEQWLDMEDLLKWLQRCYSSKRIPLPECGDGCYGDEMYAGMFATAVEMIAEQQQQEGEAGFEAAARFEGNRDGFVFTDGEHGLGYYRDQNEGIGGGDAEEGGGDGDNGDDDSDGDGDGDGDDKDAWD